MNRRVQIQARRILANRQASANIPVAFRTVCSLGVGSAGPLLLLYAQWAGSNVTRRHRLSLVIILSNKILCARLLNLWIDHVKSPRSIQGPAGGLLDKLKLSIEK